MQNRRNVGGIGKEYRKNEKNMFLECQWAACLYEERISGVSGKGGAGCTVHPGDEDAAGAGGFYFSRI